MKTCQRIGIPLALCAAVALATGAFAQPIPTTAAPATALPATAASATAAAAPAAKPLRVELPKLDVAGTYKEALGRYAEFPAGFKSPTGFHAGEEIVYIISGDYTVIIPGQPPKLYKGGDSFNMARGVRHGFSTAGGAKLVAFWVIDKGLPLDLNPENQQ
jgi:quercetin dioxygenase-like cupin family protein